MFNRIDYGALVQGAQAMGYNDLPPTATEVMIDQDGAFAQKFHHALLEIHLEEGALICPETGRRFEVKAGVPNMKLNEDEV